MNYNKEIAEKIKSEYDFNDYELSKEKLIEITVIIENLYSKNMSSLDVFFKDLHVGKLGMFYKQPISFLSIAQKYYQTHNNLMVAAR